MRPSPATQTRHVLTILIAVTLIGSLLVLCQSQTDLERPRATATKHTLTVTALRAEHRVRVVNSTGSSPPFAPSEDLELVLPSQTPLQQPRPPIRRFRVDYECVGWRATSDCSPDGERDPAGDVGCDVSIPGGFSGYCLYRHKHTNDSKRVLSMHCDSLPTNVVFDCEYAAQLMDYSARSLGYTHDESLSIAAIQRRAQAENNGTDLSTTSLERGIAMVVYGEILASAYASIRLLRELGTTLPVEVWYKPVEVASSHALLVDLVTNYGVLLREILDPFATEYYTKLYAVFYSTFDNVLLLDADNFAVRDPTFLFDTNEFVSTGAIFWPDFWHPDSTIFHVNAHSVLWEVFGLPFVDMFEQESGQLLIDRRRHLRALNLLMYYGFSLPRVHEELVWGDKDLFRLAWLKTDSAFHMIATPPASAGSLRLATNQFCGLTMVQHDPQGEILFLHRNLAKFRVDMLNQRVWTHVLQFKPDKPRSKYVIQWSKPFADITSCWGRIEDVETLTDFTLTPIASFAFCDTEARLLQLVDEAAIVIYNGGRTGTTEVAHSPIERDPSR